MNDVRRRERLKPMLILLWLFLVEEKEPKQIARMMGKSKSWAWKKLKKAG